MYGDHDVSCAGIIGIKHRHNAVRDTMVDICFRLGISTGKEVDIELGGGCDKVLRPADMLLYSWDSGFDVCVDLTGSSPLIVSGRAVIDISQRKRGISKSFSATNKVWYLHTSKQHALVLPQSEYCQKKKTSE
nr:hypothetical protein [Tanacetum cinerariifolium]